MLFFYNHDEYLKYYNMIKHEDKKSFFAIYLKGFNNLIKIEKNLFCRDSSVGRAGD